MAKQRMPRASGKDVVAALKRGGWIVEDIEGHLAHPTRGRKVTVSVHGTKPLHPKTLKAILNQANMTAEELRELL